LPCLLYIAAVRSTMDRNEGPMGQAKLLLTLSTVFTLALVAPTQQTPSTTPPSPVAPGTPVVGPVDLWPKVLDSLPTRIGRRDLCRASLRAR
jgi:hypothetical protein